MSTYNEKNTEKNNYDYSSISDAELMLKLECFADQTDDFAQKHLLSELMARYSKMSKQVEDQNLQFKKYSDNIEELVQEKVKEISASQIATIHALLKAAESRDDDTGTHIERTSLYCRLIAEKLYEAGKYPEEIDGNYAENISKASSLHDVGKIRIGDSILLKPGRLMIEEFEIMKTHVDIGYETLESAQATYPENVFLKIGLEIAKNHHEKWDGSGYMQGLTGEEIPLAARIMALSDVYDALRSKRVYKEPFSHEKTYTIMVEEIDRHFDPVLMDLFKEHHLQFAEIFENLSCKKQ